MRKIQGTSLQNGILRIYYNGIKRVGRKEPQQTEKGPVVMLELRNVSYRVENEGVEKYILKDIINMKMFT